MICAYADSVSLKIIQGRHIVGKPPREWTNGTHRIMDIRTSITVDIVDQDLLDGREGVATMTVTGRAIVRLATIEAGVTVEAGP